MQLADERRPEDDRAQRGLEAGRVGRRRPPAAAACRRGGEGRGNRAAARRLPAQLLDAARRCARAPRSATYAAALVHALPSVRTVLVGNEPNLNLFWMPQFDPSGGDAAAAAYEQLLATTYDALKSADSKLTVVGGSLAPRGGDDPSASRQTHSPTSFIKDLGSAYRASGRTKPLMDMFSIHVYGESPKIPPSFRHPHTTSIGIADYDKLVIAPRPGVRRDGAGGIEAADRLRRVRRRDRRAAAQASGYTGTEVVPTADVRDAGARLPPGDRARGMPEERACARLLPRDRRAEARRPAERAVLRRRHGQSRVSTRCAQRSSIRLSLI